MEILQVVSHGDWNTVTNHYEGLEMSQLGCVWYSSLPGVLKFVDLCPKMPGVLKWVNSDGKHKGLERRQFLTFSWGSLCWGLERSQFWWSVTKRCSSCSRIPHRVLKEVQRLMLKVGMTFSRPISPYCMVPGVKSLEVGATSPVSSAGDDWVMGVTWSRMFR